MDCAGDAGAPGPDTVLRERTCTHYTPLPCELNLRSLDSDDLFIPRENSMSESSY